MPLVMGEKQKGPVTVVMQTPYGATEMKGLVKALSVIDKKFGRVGKVFYEGSFVIGRKLPRLAPKYDFSICVRDHPNHLKAFAHLGGSGRHTDPMEEVRERLDDDDRLLRRDQADAFEDMLDMATATVVPVLMPGSARMAQAERLSAAHGLIPVLAAQPTGLDYADDLDPGPLPVTLLVVTPEDYTDVGVLLLARAHLTHLGYRVGKIVHTPSMAMEVLTSLQDGTLFEEINENDALAMPFMLFDANPEYGVVAGDTALGAAVLNIAPTRKHQFRYAVIS
jgi:hypothetical protein